MRVQGSHGLLSSIFFVSFLLSGCCDDGFFCCTSHLTAWGPSSTVVLVLESPFASENQIFFVGLTLSWTNAVGDANANFVVRNTYNGTDFANKLSLLLPTWNTTANNNRTVTNNNGTFCANKAVLSSFWRWNFKIKRRKRPCAYYSNSTATFHCLLVGDLVFKLNPGSENNDNLSTLCSHGIRKTPPSMRSRNPSNFTVVNRLPLVKNVNPRTDRVGGGTALIYRDLLHVKKISAGVKESFEFSELIVQQPSSHNLRVIILYRPPSSAVRRLSVMTLSYTSRLVPRRTPARLMRLLLWNIAFKTSGSGCLKTGCS